MKAESTIFQHHLFKPLLLILFFIFAYYLPLKGIVETWWKNEDYSYGFLIPVVSAYLFWDQRDRLRGINARTSWIVLPALLLFVALSIYGILGSSPYISWTSVPILVILFAAFAFGITLTWKSILPLGFLIFMIPLPAVVDRTLGVFLKHVSSVLGGEFLQALGISVHVSGNVIDLGVTQLQVVDACSGLRFLFPLFALGVLYAYFFERVWWKRVVSVLATIPIAIFTNALRIGITGLLTLRFGTKVAEGFFHGFSGWVIFMVAFGFLFLFGKLLALFPPQNPYRKTPSASPPSVDSSLPRFGKSVNPGFFVSVFLLIVVAALGLSTRKLPPIQIRGGIESFPLSFNGWSGRSEYVDPEIVAQSGADQSFAGLYTTGSGENVSLYFGYRATAFLEEENFFHTPSICMPTGGRTIVEETTRAISGVPGFPNLRVTKIIMEYMGTRDLVYFWFQTKTRATHDKDINRFHLALHALQRDNTYDFLIRTITPIGKDESVEQAEATLDRFVRDMMATLLTFMEQRQYQEKR